MTRLEIISDPICPWCYLGAWALERALDSRPGAPLAITWKPFQLNPDMPKGGMDRRAYLDTKFGGKEAAEAVYSRIEAAMSDAGLPFHLAAIQRTPNTLDAHRLIRWAGLEGVQGAAVMALFHGYFEEGRDIGNQTVLEDIAGEAGMDRAVVRRLLSGTTDATVVAEDCEAARDMGVTGVPTFVLGGRYVLAGAQPVETWTRLIDELQAASSAPG